MSDRYACSELTDPNFNPRKQCITLFYPDGSNTSVPLVAMNEIRVEGIQWTIMFSTQIGACGILLIIFALLTSSKKRKTALFIVNMLALICAIVRAVLAVQWYLGPIHDIYRYMAYDFSDIGMTPRWVSVFSTTSGLALQIFIHLSLILQMRVVYSSTPKLNMAITLLACALALTSTGLYFKWTVMNNIANLALISYTGDWVYGTAKQLFAACITFYSFIFLLKLGYAIRQRRVLGLRSFGAMQIIFTMACQTMIIPALFSILDVVFARIDGFAMLTPALTAILLPLSAMWAAAKVDNPAPASATGLRSYKDVFGSNDTASEQMNFVGSHGTIGGSGHRRAHVDSGNLEDGLSSHNLHVLVEETFEIESITDTSYGSSVGPYKK